MAEIRLLLAIEPDIPREGLRKILESEPGFELVLVCSTGKEAVEGAVEHEPEVVIMDDDLLESAGFDVIDSIHQKLPNASLFVVTWSKEIADFCSAYRSGVRGYLIKGYKGENLINAIKVVHSGEVVISSPIATAVVEQLSLLEKQKSAAKLADSVRLGRREKEVLTLAAQGLTNSEIASALFVSEHTVKQHMRNIMGKLRAHTRQQAVALATEKRLLS